ncbi:hypothetical protein [Desulforamulus reducens]|nr:hypothetical protein [Desulforamulus reducens]
MNNKLLVSGLLIGVLLLSIPVLSWGNWRGNFGVGGMGQGIPGMGMMSSSMMGMHGNMMGSGGVDLKEPVDLETAKELVNDYLKTSGMEGISLAELMEFDTHFYVETREDQSGKYAHEFILDKRTGSLSPEMGPNMMWNVKYGHMGGMMGAGATSGKPMVSAENAVKLANEFLVRESTRETAAEPHEFYGYYTLHTLKDGKIAGMLSVNSATGQVWYHTWHGQFINMESADGHAHQEA